MDLAHVELMSQALASREIDAHHAGVNCRGRSDIQQLVRGIECDTTAAADAEL